ncbi:MAG: hypothetical protein VW548_04175, partial [Methylotenera sp.]
HDSLVTLQSFGYKDSNSAWRFVTGWGRANTRATRSARARQILFALTPELIETVGRTPDPNASLARFDRFISELPFGVQVFSLLRSNSWLLNFLMEMFAVAPDLSELLADRPALLDGLLDRTFFERFPTEDKLERELAAAVGDEGEVEAALGACRRWLNECQFRIGVLFLRGTLNSDEATHQYSVAAEAIIRKVLRIVQLEFEKQFGNVPEGRFSIIALGKLGSREMSVRSDLDIITIYDAPDELTESVGGRKSLPAAMYYARLSTRLVSAITAQMADGRLFEVDLRLRPTGTKGPVTTSLKGFKLYHDGSAWTWECMALTRARAVAGDRSLSDEMIGIIEGIIRRKRDDQVLVRDVGEMRELIEKTNKPESAWDVKYISGGIIDCEFIAQYLLLKHSAEKPNIITPNTTKAVENAGAMGILEDKECAALVNAIRLWRTIQLVTRLTSSGQSDEQIRTASLSIAFERIGMGAIDDVKSVVDNTALVARSIYEKLIGMHVNRDKGLGSTASPK